MAIYTVILEYAGGTYVEQVGAENPQEALQAWAKAFASSHKRSKPPDWRKVLTLFAMEKAVRLDMRKSVWFVSAVIGKRLGWMHIVKTSV